MHLLPMNDHSRNARTHFAPSFASFHSRAHYPPHHVLHPITHVILAPSATVHIHAQRVLPLQQMPLISFLMPYFPDPRPPSSPDPHPFLLIHCRLELRKKPPCLAQLHSLQQPLAKMNNTASKPPFLYILYNGVFLLFSETRNKMGASVFIHFNSFTMK